MAFLPPNPGARLPPGKSRSQIRLFSFRNFFKLRAVPSCCVGPATPKSPRRYGIQAQALQSLSRHGYSRQL